MRATTAGRCRTPLRTTRTPDGVAPDLRKVVAALDRDLPVFDVVTAQSVEARTTARFRLLGQVFGGFAALGLVLAAIGVFGVVSYSTAQRSGELGMRMALGARESEVMWLVLRQGVVLTLVGGTAGLIGGFGLSRVLASLMPRLPSPEIALLLGTAALMIVVALTAMYIHARRASKISPMLALRHE